METGFIKGAGFLALAEIRHENICSTSGELSSVCIKLESARPEVATIRDTYP